MNKTNPNKTPDEIPPQKTPHQPAPEKDPLMPDSDNPINPKTDEPTKSLSRELI